MEGENSKLSVLGRVIVEVPTVKHSAAVSTSTELSRDQTSNFIMLLI